jgi:hypothetical protein
MQYISVAEKAILPIEPLLGKKASLRRASLRKEPV